MGFKDKLKETVIAGVDTARQRLAEYEASKAEEKAAYREAYREGKMQGIKAKGRRDGFRDGKGEKKERKDYSKGLEEMFAIPTMKKDKKDDGDQYGLAF